MKLDTHNYQACIRQLPASGRHIVGQFDEETIIVYQAFPKTIAKVALQAQKLMSPFCLDRLSWIKTNFMWMMYRAEWGLAEDYVLAITLRRATFEQILGQAEHAQYAPSRYANTRAWRKALQGADVRIQWDPEHDPIGKRLPRKALQIGLSGHMLKEYATRWILSIEDISDFVRHQRPFALSNDHAKLQVPIEHVYQPQCEDICERLMLDPVP